MTRFTISRAAADILGLDRRRDWPSVVLTPLGNRYVQVQAPPGEVVRMLRVLDHAQRRGGRGKGKLWRPARAAIQRALGMTVDDPVEHHGEED